MLKIDKIGKTKMMSVVNDPFFKDKVEEITVTYEKGMFAPHSWIARGKVYFKDGNTRANQSFKGDNFDDVVLQIKSFINSLK